MGTNGSSAIGLSPPSLADGASLRRLSARREPCDARLGRTQPNAGFDKGQLSIENRRLTMGRRLVPAPIMAERAKFTSLPTARSSARDSRNADKAAIAVA